MHRALQLPFAAQFNKTHVGSIASASITMSCKAKNSYLLERVAFIENQKYFFVVTYGLTMTLTRRAIVITCFLIYFTYVVLYKKRK
jgi:hypothetical protein